MDIGQSLLLIFHYPSVSISSSIFLTMTHLVALKIFKIKQRPLFTSRKMSRTKFANSHIILQLNDTFSLLCRKICWFMVTAFMTSSTNRITRQFNPSWWEVSNLVSVTLVPSWTMLRVKSESFYVEWTSQETQEGKWDLVIKRFVHTIQVTFIHSKRNRVFKPVTEAFGVGFVSK